MKKIVNSPSRKAMKCNSEIKSAFLKGVKEGSKIRSQIHKAIIEDSKIKSQTNDNFSCIACNSCKSYILFGVTTKSTCADMTTEKLCLNYGACEFCSNRDTEECKGCIYNGVDHEYTCI